ncbi:MAG TPA: hypothetical protein VIK01_11025, partial [Polyangiaceae bacterium]
MTIALRSRPPVTLLLMATWLALLGATHCGGDAQTGGAGASAGTAGAGTAGASVGTAGAGASAGTAGAGGSGGPLSTPVGRPEAAACSATTTVDGGPVPGLGGPCTADSDCTALGDNAWCFQGKCGLDQCLTDSDCPSGNVCRCSSQLGGLALPGNACVPSGCRVDADCGSAGVCSPDNSGRCGTLLGYEC